MTHAAYLSILHCIAALKERTRHAWLQSGRQESVAEHSWRMALMAYFLREAFPKADLSRVLLMCLLHDVGEAFTGDIPTFEKTDADRAREHHLRSAWIADLPAPFSDELAALFGCDGNRGGASGEGARPHGGCSHAQRGRSRDMAAARIRLAAHLRHPGGGIFARAPRTAPRDQQRGRCRDCRPMRGAANCPCAPPSSPI